MLGRERFHHSRWLPINTTRQPAPRHGPGSVSTSDRKWTHPALTESHGVSSRRLIAKHTRCIYLNRLLGNADFLQVKALAFPN